ncbi:Zinc finger MYND domain-containing protein 15 [Aphanomyces cochlioides]|nr:Zinc finger MYND domain-containing protein 15 [Aphanomyces cochlioides]
MIIPVQSTPLSDAPDRISVHSPLSKHSVGRMISTTMAVQAGELVFSTPAFATVLRQSYVKTHCHCCFMKLQGRIIQCAECQIARYCHRECMATHLPLHDFQCALLSCLPTSVEDSDLVRLVLAVLAMEAAMQNPHVIAELTTYPLNDGKEEQTYVQAAAEIHKQLDRKRTWMMPKHIAQVFRAVRFNAHPILVDLSASPLGLGLFPDAAKMVNHSCAPNTFPRFNATTQSLEFHAMAPLAPGTLIVYSYLDVLGFALLQSKAARRAVLEKSFQFTCVCSRCLTPKETEAPCESWLEELDQAVKSKNWLVVMDRCKDLTKFWHDAGLPSHYPLMYVLAKKMETAAMHFHLPFDSTVAERIRTICGFSEREF